ncbi:MAG: methyltransferase domain-containing protein [Desulfobacterales bacterium]|jgi:ubiquinone/menaquinone biosynthesis C-methylase UbiE|nr:methyltransferase domain-containing protein [Desulfobacterales bacterium]
MKNHENKPTGAGKSSFGLIDTAKFFSELALQKGATFLDVACGWGAYSLAASDIVGKDGQVYAVDLWEEGILNLRKEADSKGFQNMATFVSDVAQNIPIENDCVDVCLMATALHDFVRDQIDRGAMKEIVRVIKPEGILVIVEYIKKDGPPGPPKPVRLSPQEVDILVSAYGFKQKRHTEIGDSHYLQIFKRIA